MEFAGQDLRNIILAVHVRGCSTVRRYVTFAHCAALAERAKPFQNQNDAAPSHRLSFCLAAFSSISAFSPFGSAR